MNISKSIAAALLITIVFVLALCLFGFGLSFMYDVEITATSSIAPWLNVFIGRLVSGLILLGFVMGIISVIELFSFSYKQCRKSPPEYRFLKK